MNKLKKIALSLIFSLLSGASAFAEEKSQEKTVIQINGADFTRYEKNKETKSDQIVLTGNVSISVTKGNTKTVITADSITYNREIDMLYAKGNVSLKQTGSSAGEQNITAATLLFNTSTLEGIFDNGRAIQTQSDAINLPSGSTLIVASDIFGRDSSNTIAFKRATLTFCDDENPHWKIWASRIWLLPGGEFAFFNAVLSVGNIPILYLPAFYYPKDELIFNPAFGYSERKGYYFQTTTYLYGRKPLDTSSSSSSSSSDTDLTKGIFNFMKASSLKEQKREGVVLHNLDSDYKGDTSNYLKLMGDWYGNLGGMVGVEGVFKPKKIFTSINANAQLGFSTTVFEQNGVYQPYSSSGDVYNDESNFMGVKAPFRYKGNLAFSISKPLTFSLAFPVYSDPFFTDDFGDRSEFLDWIGFAMSGSGKDSESENETSNTTSSFTWSASGSYTIPFPAVLKPYISSVSLSNFSSSIIFSSKTRSDDDFRSSDSGWQSKTPERSFFYPSQITPFKITGKISGTLFQYPFASSAKKNDVKFPVAMNVPEEIDASLLDKKESNPAEIAEKPETDSSKVAENSGEETSPAEASLDEQKHDETVADSSEEEFIFKQTDLPVLTKTVSTSVVPMNGLKYSLTYSINPQYTSQISYNSSDLKSPEDFDWEEVYSTYYQVKVPASLSSSLNFRDSFVSMSNNFNFNPVYQDHPNLDGYTSESSIASVKKTDYAARKLDLTNSNTVSFKPFVYNEYFKNSSLNWNTNIKMIETEFIGDVDNPEWDYKRADLTDSDSFTTHTLSATLSATEGKFSQSLTLSTSLPPQVEKYSASATFGFPLTSLSMSTGISQKSKDDDEYKWEMFKESFSLSVPVFGTDIKFSESFNYDIEENNADSLKLALSWKNLQASYTMSYTKGYEFEEGSGWVANEDKEFLPYNFSLSYSTASKTYYYWFNRITFAPTLSTNIVYDCLRPTNSYFRFVPAVTFKVFKVFDLTFSLESQNNVIFRYFQDYVGHEDMIPGEENVFVDLWNSFVFWSDDDFWDPDQLTRKSSGFKMKNLKISLTHQLCDWDLNASLTFKPRSKTNGDGSKEYDYHPYFSFSVSWRPMASMKTEVVDEYGTWKLNP